MNNLFDTFEICLQEIENGAEIESILLRFPDLADELRPILEASVKARALYVAEPSAETVRRNRAKILQRAAELRETNIKPAHRQNWFAPMRKLIATLAILILVFASGTSLVGAASTSLPGDNLYSVKRSWENLQLFFTFNVELREALDVEHENERIEELRELFANGRSAEVTFSGSVTRQTATGWLVAGIPVVISPETDLPAQPVEINSAVLVQGFTQADGSVLASSVNLLPPGASLPEVEEESLDDSNQQNEEGSVSVSEEDAPQVVVTETPESDEVTFDGILDVLNDNFWTINGVPADVSNAEVEGTPTVGAEVTVEGFFNEDGIFIVTKIKFAEDESSSGSDSNSNDSSNHNQNDDSGNDNENSNDDNENGNENGNDNDNDDD